MSRVPAAALVAILAVLLPTSAEAKVSAQVTVETKSGSTRIVATLSSTKTLPARQRPRTVTAVAGGRTYKLTRGTGKVTGRKLGTWRSAAQNGSAATRVQGLAGKKVTLRLRTRAGKRVTVPGTVPAPAAPGATPAPGTTPAPAVGAPTTGPGGAKVTPTRDDAAGQTIFRGGDLLLERYSFGASGQTAQYFRIWFYASGEFRQNTISWNSVSGEACTDTKVGTWKFLEGYSFPEAGGGLFVKVELAGQLTGQELLVAGNAEPNNVYIGTQAIQFARNPQMQQNC